MKYRIILISALLFALCSCEDEKQGPINKGGMGHAIGLGQVEVNSTDAKTKSSIVNEYTFDEVSGQAGDFEYSYSSSIIVSPIESEATKFTDASSVITRNSLKTSGFYVDGFLNKENMLESDTQHFISAAPTEYISDEIDRWQFKSEYKWRDRLNHFFWAYCNDNTSENALNFTMSYASGDAPYSQASFSYKPKGIEKSIDGYDQQDYYDYFEKDLVIAAHQQYWDETLCNNHTGDELTMLKFKHALSEVNFTYNITFKKYTNKEDVSPRTKGDNWLDVNDHSKGQRATLKYAGLLLYTQGGCVAIPAYDSNETVSFTWANDGLTSSNVMLSFPGFVIPQDVTAIKAVFNIDDKAWARGNFYLPLPVGDALTTLSAGYKYEFNYNCEFVLPYVPEGQEGYNPNFFGKVPQVAAPFDEIDLTRIKKLRINWTSLPYGHSSGSGGAKVKLILTNRSIDIIPGSKGDCTVPDPSTSHTELDNKSYTNINNYYQIFGYKSVSPTNPYIQSFTLFNTLSDHVDDTIYDTDYDVIINGTKISEGGSTLVSGEGNLDTASVTIDNIDVSGLSGVWYLYLGSIDGDNGATHWTLKNLNFDVIEWGE